MLGCKFLIRTDHNSLVWLTKFRNIQGQLARWLEELSQYDFSIIHRPGKLHGNADGMSRIPDTLQPCECYVAGVEVTSLSCGGCLYCTRAHHQWERFNEDDVIPLAMRTITTHIGDTQSALSDDEEVSMDQDEQIQLVGYTPEKQFQAELQFYHAGMPLEQVHIDVVAPLVESHRGNKLILVLVDQFTKWLECYAVPDQTAEVVCTELVNQFITRLGLPQPIHSDQGRNFESGLLQQLCRTLDITKTRTTPYRPSANGQVERYNIILLPAARCYIDGKQREWDENLTLLSIRSTINRSTGFTPNFLMLGREISIPDELFGVTTANNLSQDVSPYIRELIKNLKVAHQAVRDCLKQSQERQQSYYDRSKRQRTFDIGDLVYKLDTTTKVGLTTKLKPIYTGPFLVTEIMSPILYRIEDRKRPSVIHHDRLRICKDRAIPLWMQRKRHHFLRNLEDENLAIFNDLDATSGMTQSIEDPAVEISSEEEDIKLDLIFDSETFTRRGRKIVKPTKLKILCELGGS